MLPLVKDQTGCSVLVPAARIDPPLPVGESLPDTSSGGHVRCQTCPARRIIQHRTFPQERIHLGQSTAARDHVQCWTCLPGGNVQHRCQTHPAWGYPGCQSCPTSREQLYSTVPPWNTPGVPLDSTQGTARQLHGTQRTFQEGLQRWSMPPPPLHRLLITVESNLEDSPSLLTGCRAPHQSTQMGLRSLPLRVLMQDLPRLRRSLIMS